MKRMKKLTLWSAVLMILLIWVLGCGVLGPGAEDAPATDEPPTVEETTDETATPKVTDEPTAVPPHATVWDVINAVLASPLADDEERAAEKGMPIYVGGYVRAEEASTARVQVEEEKLVRVAPNTTFTFERYDEDGMKLNLGQGHMWLDVEGLEDGQTIEVETPAAVASVRGTRWSARVADDGTSIFSTQVGTVTVSAATDTVTVTAGFQTTVVPGGSPGDLEPLSLEQQTYWGMAYGSGLDVILPVTATTDVFTYTGFASHPQLSADGRYLAYVYYVPGSSKPDYGPLLRNLQAGETYTQALEGEANGISFNPAGDQLAYSNADQICKANLDGTEPACFGDTRYFWGWPHWSPDGEWFLFYSNRASGSSATNLFKSRTDGSELTQLTDNSQGRAGGQSWSPDGSQIAYTYGLDYLEPAEVWVMNADGSEPAQVFTNTWSYVYPVWRPDGASLAVSGFQDKETGEGGGLWLASLDGSDPTVVPGTERWRCYDAAWSPSSSGWPLFFRAYDADGYRGIYWYKPDIGQAMHFSDANQGPLWSADGTRVGFVYSHDEAEMPWSEVYVFGAEPDFLAP